MAYWERCQEIERICPAASSGEAAKPASLSDCVASLLACEADCARQARSHVVLMHGTESEVHQLDAALEEAGAKDVVIFTIAARERRHLGAVLEDLTWRLRDERTSSQAEAGRVASPLTQLMMDLVIGHPACLPEGPLEGPQIVNLTLRLAYVNRLDAWLFCEGRLDDSFWRALIPKVQELMHAALSSPQRLQQIGGWASEAFFTKLFERWLAIFRSECAPGSGTCATCGVRRKPMSSRESPGPPAATAGPTDPGKPRLEVASTDDAGDGGIDPPTCPHLPDSASVLRPCLDGGVHLLSLAATKTGAAWAVKLLLENGASPYVSLGSDMWPPLLAAASGNLPALQLLLSHMARYPTGVAELPVVALLLACGQSVQRDPTSAAVPGIQKHIAKLLQHVPPRRIEVGGEWADAFHEALDALGAAAKGVLKKRHELRLPPRSSSKAPAAVPSRCLVPLNPLYRWDSPALEMLGYPMEHPVYAAIAANDMETLKKVVIVLGGDILALDSKGVPPLFQAARDNALEVLEILAESPSFKEALNWRDPKHGLTALGFATAWNYTQACSALLAKIRWRNFDKALLLTRGVVSEGYHAPLFIASILNYRDLLLSIVPFLDPASPAFLERWKVQAGQAAIEMKVADPEAADAETVTLPMCVAAMGDAQVLQALLDIGVPIHPPPGSNNKWFRDAVTMAIDFPDFQPVIPQSRGETSVPPPSPLSSPKPSPAHSLNSEGGPCSWEHACGDPMMHASCADRAANASPTKIGGKVGALAGDSNTRADKEWCGSFPELGTPEGPASATSTAHVPEQRERASRGEASKPVAASGKADPTSIPSEGAIASPTPSKKKRGKASRGASASASPAKSKQGGTNDPAVPGAQAGAGQETKVTVLGLQGLSLKGYSLGRRKNLGVKVRVPRLATPRPG
eukprot:jgi/Botrbrau1/19517/Bobra.0035s0017.1